MAMMKHVGCLNIFHHVCLEIDAHLDWLNELEYWKIKHEIKNLLFVAFQQKENPRTLEPWMLSSQYLHTTSQVSLAEY
jgi:hypothetical protein